MLHDLGREQHTLYESDAQIIKLACHRFGIEAIEGSRKQWLSVQDLVLVDEKCRQVRQSTGLAMSGSCYRCSILLA